MANKVVLIVDDEPVIRNALKRLLKRHSFDVIEADSVAAAKSQIHQAIDLILADVRLPDGQGTELLDQRLQVPVVMMTSYASIRSAVEAMQRGAFDYISKPFDNDEIVITLKRAIEQSTVRREHAALKKTVLRQYPTNHIIGQSAPMKRLLDQVMRVAPTDIAVLITGESGTGKELVARALHANSQRADSPIIAVNCGAIPEGLIESELFGHEKGAFTGATDRRIGLAESAQGGTLFLDEIGELPLDAQTRLLRLIENGEVRPVGSSTLKRVNIRLVAATHRDLALLVQQGEFREDLFYRLNVMQLNVPALRERGQDILLLAQHYLDNSPLNHRQLRFSEEATEALLSNAWPGNVRELQNAVNRALVLCDGDEINAYHLNLDQTLKTSENKILPKLSLDDYFRYFIDKYQASMNETELAEALGLSRKALWERRQRMDLPRIK